MTSRISNSVGGCRRARRAGRCSAQRRVTEGRLVVPRRLVAGQSGTENLEAADDVGVEHLASTATSRRRSTSPTSSPTTSAPSCCLRGRSRTASTRSPARRRRKARIGYVDVLPPTLSLQWHFNPNGTASVHRRRLQLHDVLGRGTARRFAGARASRSTIRGRGGPHRRRHRRQQELVLQPDVRYIDMSSSITVELSTESGSSATPGRCRDQPDGLRPACRLSLGPPGAGRRLRPCLRRLRRRRRRRLPPSAVTRTTMAYATRPTSARAPRLA